MPHPLFMPDTLCENVLLFDGLTRSGRALVAPLVSDFPGIEFAEPNNAIDHIPVLWRLGLLEDQSAAAYLRMTVDGCTYERAIGRRMNMRHSDYHSVYQSLNANDILRRAFGEEHQAAMDRFNREGRVSSFITHHTLPMAKLWFKAFPKLRVLLTTRHPVDLCHSWHGRGWGERFGRDPLSFWPVPEIDGNPVPEFAVDFADEYIRLDPMGRIVKSVLTLNRMNEKALNGFSKKLRPQVQTVCFEKMATEPMEELEKIAAWLETTLHPQMHVQMARQRTPRELPIEDRRAKLENIKRDIEPDLLDQLLETSHAYEEEWGLDSV